MSLLKRAAKKILSPVVFVFLSSIKNKFINSLKGKTTHSAFDEEIIIKKYLDNLPLENNYCVDIAASDGITMSNTYSFFKNTWQGMAVEYNPIKFAELANSYRKFSNVSLLKVKVIPENILSVLGACLCPKDFAFLSFDIDSYDYFVLEKLLSEFRPRLICTEINENIPPPYKF
ncbi:MAG: hypothetical protein WC244_01050 [Patescibacteria group bacterium]|jgi:hypothetical protein